MSLVQGLTREDAAAQALPRVNFPVGRSAEDGRFAITGVPSGKYRVVANREGYASQEFGAVLEVLSGKTLTNISIALTPAATVEGRIVSTTGDPLLGMEVALLRQRYNEHGALEYFTEAWARTNDRGEYRIFGVSPGRFYLMARGALRVFPGEMAQISINAIAETSPGKYPTTFYPGVRDLAAAQRVDIAAGAAIKNLNLALTREKGYQIHGRVIDEATGNPAWGVGFGLLTLPSIGPQLTVSMYSAAYNLNDGTFDLNLAAPSRGTDGFGSGSYWIVATRSLRTGENLLPGMIDRLSVRVPVEIKDADVNDLVIRIPKLVSVRGEITVEGAVAVAPNLETIRVSLQSVTDQQWPSYGMGATRSRHTPIAKDGAFLFENVLPDSFRVLVSGLPENLYIKQIRFGETDVLAQPMKLSGATTDALKMIVAAGAARLEGVVLDGNSQPQAHRQVVLIPDRQRERVDLYRTATTSEAGAFTIKGITPGAYKAFSWEAIEPFAYFGADFMAENEGRGVSIRFAEGSVEQIRLRP